MPPQTVRLPSPAGPNPRLDAMNALLATPLLLLLLAGASSAQSGSGFCSGQPNSTGAASTIASTGSLEVANNDLTLHCAALPQNAFGYFLVSTTSQATFFPGGSSGTLCLGGAIGRYAGSILTTGATGAVSMPVDLTALPSPNGSVAAQPDDTWFFQFWHRDTSPSGVTSNFSPGLQVHFNNAAPTFLGDIWPMLAQPNVNATACILCHDANHPTGLNMQVAPNLAYAALVNATSTSQNCGGSTYVVPFDPASSLLFDKLSNPTPACGVQMPFGGTFAGDIDVLRNWILNGALL